MNLLAYAIDPKHEVVAYIEKYSTDFHDVNLKEYIGMVQVFIRYQENEHSEVYFQCSGVFNKLQASIDSIKDNEEYTCVEIIEVEESEKRKLQMTKDGDQYCVLFGDDIQKGISGFGDTPEEAIDNFCDAWPKIID